MWILHRVFSKNMPKLTGSLLDLGCGYGPIGIVLGKINPIELTMSDVNKRWNMPGAIASITELKPISFIRTAFRILIKYLTI